MKNMNFGQAWELLKTGEKVKRAHWSGYWALENGTIIMHCKDGSVIDIKDMEDVVYTFDGIAAEDWQVAEESNSKLMAGELVPTFMFGEAIRMLKAGKKVARKGWSDKGMFIVLMPALYLPPYNTQDTSRKVNDRTAKWIGEDNPLDCQPYIAMYNAKKQWQPGWVASQADMLSDDWTVLD